MAQEEEVISTNKFKKARNEFRKSREEKEVEEEDESEDNSIEDINEEEPVVIKKERSQNQPEITDEAAAPKRKRKAPKEKVNPLQPIINFIKDERLHRVVGLALILSSVYLLVAFTSFLFTWKTDQDKVMGSWWQLFFPAMNWYPL